MWEKNHGERWLRFPAYSEYVYKAFLKFDDGEKIELLVNADKDNLMRMLNRYNDTLQTAIWDNTGEWARAGSAQVSPRRATVRQYSEQLMMRFFYD